MQVAISFSRRVVSGRRISTRLSLLVLCYCLAAASGASAQQYFNVIDTFNGNNAGSQTAPLIQATNGNLYGTSQGGQTETQCDERGTTTCGTIFQVPGYPHRHPDHALRVLPACELRRRIFAHGGTGGGIKRELLWRNSRGRSQRWRNSFRNHSSGRADHPLQLLFGRTSMYRRQPAEWRTVARFGWQLLWNYPVWRPCSRLCFV
jgi:hypothetical protein